MPGGQRTAANVRNRRTAVPRGGVLLCGGRTVRPASAMHYQDDLAAVAGRRTELGLLVDILVELVPEPTNPYDPRAVSIRCGRTCVGYLSREGARAYSPALDELAAGGKRAFCNAEIRGAWDRDGDRGAYGLFVDLGRPRDVLAGIKKLP
jgi:HIRAN domain